MNHTGLASCGCLDCTCASWADAFGYSEGEDSSLEYPSPTEPAPADELVDIEKLPAPAPVPREMRDTTPPAPRAKRLRAGPCYFCPKPAVDKLANGCPICGECKEQNERRKPKEKAA